MVKRSNQITALILAVTSITSVTPAMASIIKLSEQDGQISRAIAYKDGKYIYEGYKNDDENGVYYNNGVDRTNEKRIDDIDSLDDTTKLNGSYIGSGPKDNILINLEDGSVIEDYINKNDAEDIVKNKLKRQLRRTNRYSRDVNVESVNQINKGGFKDSTWYSYVAEGSDDYNESDFIKEDTDKYDENKFKDQSRVEINIRALWEEKIRVAGKEFDAGSTTKNGVRLLINKIKEANFDNYTVGQIGTFSDDGENYYIKLTLLPKESYEVPAELTSGFLALGTTEDSKVVWRENLEAWEASAIPTIIGGTIIQDTWSSEYDNKTRVEVEARALYNSKFRIDGKEFDAGSNTLSGAKKIKQELLSAEFEHYTIGQAAMLTDDGQYYYVKVTLLPKDGYQVPSELEDGFIAMSPDNGTTWQTNFTWEMSARLKMVKGAVSKDELSALYNAHKDDEQGSYTDASWEVLTAALNNAKTVIDNENATQDTVNLAKTNLSNAINGLEEGTNENEYGTIITINIPQFWASIEIAGVNCSADWNNSISDFDPNSVVTKLLDAKTSDSFNGGYKLISAVYDGSKVAVKLGLTEKLSEFPFTIAKFNGNILVEEWSDIHDPSWTMKASMETYDIEAPNSLSSVIQDNSLATEVTSSAQVQVQSIGITVGNMNAETYVDDNESRGKAVYYGYTNGNGKYIDCSQIANLTVFNGERVAKIEKFNSRSTKYGSEIKIGLPRLVDTLGQDDNYIYSLISVPVLGAKTEYGSTDIDEPLYYIQKISKEVSDTKIDEAFLPKSVETYQLNDSMISGGNGWSGDNWKYRNAKDYIVNQYLNDSSSRISFSNGAMYFIHIKTNDDEDKVLESAKMLFKDSAKITLDNGEEIREKLVSIDSSNSTDEEPEDWTIDSKGNAWSIYRGVIQRSNQGNEFEDMYKVYKGINKLDVYDENNFIAWSRNDEVYVTAKEGEVATKIVKKTGWRKEADGTWHVYDAKGKDVKGWAQFGSGWYYFGENGAMTTGWINLDGKSYYLSKSGIMQIGWSKIDGIWYYFNQLGEKQKSTTIDGYVLDENGDLKN